MQDKPGLMDSRLHKKRFSVSMTVLICSWVFMMGNWLTIPPWGSSNSIRLETPRATRVALSGETATAAGTSVCVRPQNYAQNHAGDHTRVSAHGPPPVGWAFTSAVARAEWQGGAAPGLVLQGEETVNSLNLTDLGPLTPLALSPFFGITVLSGISQFADADWAQNVLASNTLPAKNPILKHPATFVVFLLLTIITSLPRLTKVTKPVAQALDWVESYSVLMIALIMLALEWSLGPAATGTEEVIVDSTLGTSNVIHAAGWGSWTLGSFLMIVGVFNYLIVKSVRFLFEFLIWISPVPLIDAAFELTNKVICFSLLVLYSISPWLALAINLSIFVVCILIYQWTKRRLDYHWHFWIEPWWHWLFPQRRAFDGRHLWLFADQDFGPFKKYDRLQVYSWEGKWMMIRYDLFWRRVVHEFTHDDLPYLETTTNRLSLVLQQQVPLRISTHRGYHQDLEAIAKGLDLPTRARLDQRNARLIRDGIPNTASNSAS